MKQQFPKHGLSGKKGQRSWEKGNGGGKPHTQPSFLPGECFQAAVQRGDQVEPSSLLMWGDTAGRQGRPRVTRAVRSKRWGAETLWRELQYHRWQPASPQRVGKPSEAGEGTTPKEQLPEIMKSWEEFVFSPARVENPVIPGHRVEYSKEHCLGFPGGAVVESLPANAGDTGSSPGLGRSHVPRSSWARDPQLLSLRVWSLCSATRGAAIVRGPRTAMKSGPRLPQLEKALAQKRRPNTAINK